MDRVVCFALDVVLLASEAVLNVWLALNLKDRGLLAEHGGIAILLVLPSIVNGVLWLTSMKNSYTLEKWHVFLCVFFGFPSPLFLYVWHLYLRIFGGHFKKSEESRVAANTFRMIQSFVMSIPLLILNLVTLLGVLKASNSNGQEGLDVNLLMDHINRVQVHGLAFALSFLNVIRSSCLFNERKTFALLFVLASFPFLLFTSLTRILSMSFIMAFMSMEWICLTGILLLLCNVILYIVTAKNSVLFLKLRKMDDYNDDDDDDDVGFDEKRKKTTRSTTSDCFRALPKTVLFSLCSIMIPCGYSNDRQSHHPRIKGGTFILLNYVLNTILISAALGLTILYYVPNQIQGISLPSLAVKVQVPGSEIFVSVFGLDISVNVPNTKVDLGSMPAVTANVNTEKSDVLLSSVIPLILSLLPFPFVMIRAVMMELDCFILRKKNFERHSIELVEKTNFESKIDPFSIQHHHRRRAKAEVLSELAKLTLHDNLVKNRLYIAIVFSFLGMIIFTLFVAVAIALAVLNLH